MYFLCLIRGEINKNMDLPTHFAIAFAVGLLFFDNHT